jgi:hypothetical protein
VAPPRPTQYALDALLDSSKEACHTRLRTVAKLSDDDEKAVAIQSLSNAQLIQILLLDDSDEDELNSITRMVETEIARRKKEGGGANDGARVPAQISRFSQQYVFKAGRGLADTQREGRRGEREP